MTENNSKNIKSGFSKKLLSLVNNTDVKVFLLSLLIAGIVWLIMILSDISKYNYSVKLKYNNYPENMVLVNQPDSIIELELTAKGFKMFSNAFNRNEFVIIPIRKYVENIDENSDFYRKGVDIKEIIPEIKMQLDVSEIGNILNPDSLIFKFARHTTKKVAIKVNHDLSFIRNYKLYGDIITTPDSIQISGPKSIIDSLTFIKTQKIVSSEISDDFEKEIKLIIPKGIKSDESYVNAYISVANCTEMETKVKLKIVNKVEDINIKAFPSYVRVKYQIALRDHDKINDSSFVIAAKLDSLTLLHGKKLLPYIDKKPDFVKNATIVDNLIDYVILEDL